MSTVKYNAKYLKDIIQPMMPSNTTKAQREHITVSVCLKTVPSTSQGTGQQGSESEVPYLQCETVQPTYSLCLLQRLQPQESVDKGETMVCDLTQLNCCEVKTADLLASLSAMGDKDLDIELKDGGAIEASHNAIVKDGNRSEERQMGNIYVYGKSVSVPDTPEALEGEGVIALAGGQDLLKGLRACVTMAKTDGNENTQRCIHLHLHRDGMVIESAYNEAPCSYMTDTTVYAIAPSSDLDVVLSLDAAKALMQLLAVNTNCEVRIMKDAQCLMLNVGVFTMLADVQPVVCRDYCDMRDYTYQMAWPLERKALTSALQSLRAWGEKEVEVNLSASGLLLQGASCAQGESNLTVDVASGKAATGLPNGFQMYAGRFPITSFLTALSTCWEEAEARLSRDADSTALCIDCGKLRMMVKRV